MEKGTMSDVQQWNTITREENIATQLKLQDLTAAVKLLIDKKNESMQKVINYKNELQSHIVKYDKMKEKYENLESAFENEKALMEQDLFDELKKNNEITEAKTHLQHAKQLLEKRTEKLYEENLKLKLELETLQSDNKIRRHGNEVTTKFENLSNLMNILMEETASINRRISQTTELTQVLRNEHKDIKKRCARSNTLCLTQQQHIRDLQHDIKCKIGKIENLKRLHHKSKEERDQALVLNDNLKEEVKQKDKMINEIRSQLRESNETLQYISKHRDKMKSNIQILKGMLQEYQVESVRQKSLRQDALDLLSLKDRLVKNYEMSIHKMQQNEILAVLEDLISRTAASFHSARESPKKKILEETISPCHTKTGANIHHKLESSADTSTIAWNISIK